MNYIKWFMKYTGESIQDLGQRRFYAAREKRNCPAIFGKSLQHPIATTAVKWFMRCLEKSTEGPV
jgi:hypothetical protein